MYITDMTCYTDWITLVEKGDGRAAELWIISNAGLWPQRKKLKVRFMNKIPAWRREDEQFISKDDILRIANEWYRCGVDIKNDVVPEFVPWHEGETSDIRVEFIGKYVVQMLVLCMLKYTMICRVWDSPF